MKISSHSKEYFAEITEKAFISRILQEPHKLTVIDERVFDLYKDSILETVDEKQVYLFNAVEKNKNISSALQICNEMAKLSFKRSDVLISVGGGIVQDVTGFAANIYNRGVKWIFVPTTLLAQCDSCIGSKTSLNFSRFKNILGTFYPPDNVYICLEFVKTLTKNDYLSGLGEVAKFNIMSAKDGLELLEKNMVKLLSRDVETLRFFIERSLEFKKRFIEEDEYDLGIRNLLNFAHTFGHAFETVSHYAIPHGQAVTLGLIVANDLSLNRNILEKELKERIENLCFGLISIKLDKGLFNPNKIVEAMKKDKKRRTEKLAAVLLSTDLSLNVVQDIEFNEIKESLSKIFKTIQKNN